MEGLGLVSGVLGRNATAWATGGIWLSLGHGLSRGCPQGSREWVALYEVARHGVLSPSGPYLYFLCFDREVGRLHKGNRGHQHTPGVRADPV